MKLQRYVLSLLIELFIFSSKKFYHSITRSSITHSLVMFPYNVKEIDDSDSGGSLEVPTPGFSQFGLEKALKGKSRSKVEQSITIIVHVAV